MAASWFSTTYVPVLGKDDPRNCLVFGLGDCILTALLYLIPCSS
jgi:hypothetical protein